MRTIDNWQIRVVILFLSSLLTGCLDLKVPFSDSDETSSVSKVSLSSNSSIVIDGSHLDKVKGLKISDSSGTKTTLVVLQQGSNQIQAKSSVPLSLLVGGAYKLLVSTASADQTFPITIQIANGSLNPSSLSGAGATSGMVLTWSGSAWAPANPSGGGGAGAGVFWLVKTSDNTPIAQIITWQGGSNFTVWDEADSVSVNYGNNGGTNTVNKVSGQGSFYLNYTTANCSDTPHSSGNLTNTAGSVPNTAWGIGGVLYKVESVSDTINVVAMQGETAGGALMPCTAVNPPISGNFFRLMPIPSPGVPMTLAAGSYKLLSNSCRWR